MKRISSFFGLFFFTFFLRLQIYEAIAAILWLFVSYGLDCNFFAHMRQCDSDFYFSIFCCFFSKWFFKSIHRPF